MRTYHSFFKWINVGLNRLEGLDFFDAKTGCKQGDISSPLTWVLGFDIILFSALEDDPHGGFRLRLPNETQYAAPDVCFAVDLQSYAATFVQLQRKVELIAGYAAIYRMQIAVQKLRTYHIRGRQYDLRQLASDKGL